MTQEQPEALRLADEFKQCVECDAIPSIIDIEKAASELRRLHAENAELRHGAAVAATTIQALRAELDRAKQSASLIRDALHSIPESQS